MTQDIFETRAGGAAPGEPLIAIRDLVKTYYIGKPNELEILHGISLTVWPGEFVAIVGDRAPANPPMMNIHPGALDRPTSGTYHLDGVDVEKATDPQLSAIRNRKIGFVFQTFNLIGRTTAQKNVELPCCTRACPLASARPGPKRCWRWWAWPTAPGTSPASSPAGRSSGWPSPGLPWPATRRCCWPTEPTRGAGLPDSRTVMDIFHDLHEQQGKTIVLITHNPELAEECGRILTLKDGRIISERKGSGARGTA